MSCQNRSGHGLTGLTGSYGLEEKTSVSIAWANMGLLSAGQSHAASDARENITQASMIPHLRRINNQSKMLHLHQMLRRGQLLLNNFCTLQPSLTDLPTTSTGCLLKTAVIEIRSGSHCCKAQILFDEGAQHSFMTQQLACDLNIQPDKSQ